MTITQTTRGTALVRQLLDIISDADRGTDYWQGTEPIHNAKVE